METVTLTLWQLLASPAVFTFAKDVLFIILIGVSLEDWKGRISQEGKTDKVSSSFPKVCFLLGVGVIWMSCVWEEHVVTSPLVNAALCLCHLTDVSVG